MLKLVFFTAIIALAQGGLVRDFCPPKPPTVPDFDVTKVSVNISDDSQD